MENKNLTFEQANELLEKTVSKMESGEFTLEQTMEEYAKACELLAYCMKQLEQCKGKIIDINERISKLSKGDVKNILQKKNIKQSNVNSFHIVIPSL